MTKLRQAAVRFTAVMSLALVVLVVACGGSSGAPNLSRVEEQALLEEAVTEAQGDLAAFVATGVNPCGLEVTELLAEYFFSYEDLPSLINDVDLIVEGRFGVSSMEPPEPGKIASRMPVEFEVDDVLLGDSPGPNIIVGAGGGVTMSRDQPRRYHVPWLDQCAIEHAILFFDGPAEEGVHNVVAHLAFVDERSEADPFRNLLEEGVPVQDVRTDILRMIEEQQAEGVPKGRLQCESRRNSSFYRDPLACPGDSFNPYEAYGLARPLEIDIRRMGADGQLLGARGDVPTDAPEAIALLATLDRTVLMESGDEPEGEIIELSVITTTTGTPPFDVSLRYEVATDWIWVSLSGGGFDAPEGFGGALEALLEASQSDSPTVETNTPQPASPASTLERGVPRSTSVAPRTSVGPEMRLTLVAGGYCTGNDCFADVGSTFTLAIEVLEAPASYVLLQTFINYGVYDPTASEDGAGPNSCSDGVQNGFQDGVDRTDSDCVVLELTYFPTTRAADEMLWTELEAATAVRPDFGPGLLGHGGITGLIPPLPESSETGVMVQLQMSCPAAATTVPISLLLYDDPLAMTSGSAFVRAGGGPKIIPTVSPITLHCVVP